MYEATDNDLPEFLFDPSKVPEKPAIDARKRAEQAALHHFPAITAKQQRREARALRKAEQEGDGLFDKPVYIKLAKRAQMFQWLIGLQETFPAMKDRERDFCEKLYRKFCKYTPENTKWITRKQYDWLKQLATDYLMIER